MRTRWWSTSPAGSMETMKALRDALESLAESRAKAPERDPADVKKGKEILRDALVNLMNDCFSWRKYLFFEIACFAISKKWGLVYED